MEPSDLALLVVLGTADAGSASLKDITEAARSLAPMDWQPTAETMRACVARALVKGLLQPVDGSGGDAGSALATSAAGRAVIVELLRRPIARTNGGFIRACMSAKLCFLHHLPPTERRRERDPKVAVPRRHQAPPPVAAAAAPARRRSVARPSSRDRLPGIRA